jgi:enediyne biosynthesis protein E4
MKKLILPYVIAAVGFGSAVAHSFAQQFVDVSTTVGFVMEAKKSKGDPVWGDFNNDGVLDLIVPCHGLSLSHGPFVYLGNVNGTFTDIRSTCGFSNLRQFDSYDSTDWHGFSLADYDNDGNLDLYIAEGAKAQNGGMIKRDLLFHGNGDGTFHYVSDVAGIEAYANRGRQGFWVDYDNDGKLDLFVKNFKDANGFINYNRLYHNNGNGTFTMIAGAGGLDSATFGKKAGDTASFVDYDNDGYMDVAFAGEATSEALYKNKGGGTFIDVTTNAGLKKLRPSQGIAWGDYNNDGLVDLYIARGNLGTGPYKNTLYRNNGNGTFTDVTAQAGVGGGGNYWAAIWGDYDNDGYLDLFVACSGGAAVGSPGNANLLYHNNGDGTFTNVARQQGVELEDGGASTHRACAWADYNNDGFLDLIIKDGCGPEGGTTTAPALGLHRLFKNKGNNNHFIKVKLRGVQSNRNGIGARVTVSYTSGTQNRIAFCQHYGGGGGEFWSQGNQPLHFGIGSATTATVKVEWPSGRIDTLSAVAANSTITVREGSAP